MSLKSNPFEDLSSGIIATDIPLFHKEKHITYWLRCLRSPLPHQYTSMDSQRMTLAFFTISALDLLGVLFTRTSQAERNEYIDWIYKCQHIDGGFRGHTGTDFGKRRNEGNAIWDPANTPATYFAVSTLCILGDDLSRINRKKCLSWLNKMQRVDGSFGESLGEHDEVMGGMDTRFAYCSVVVRWILRGDVEGAVDGVPDIRIDELVECIRAAETFEGGIADIPYHEAQAGFTYCAIATLALLNRLPSRAGENTYSANRAVEDSRTSGLSSLEMTVRWLVSRMTTMIDEEDYPLNTNDDSDTSSDADTSEEVGPSDLTPEKSFIRGKSRPVSTGDVPMEMPVDMDVNSSWPFDPPHSHWAGFNGRANKIADTCYGFWVGGSLAILNSTHLLTSAPIRRYLCEKTQHPIAGGFSKLPDQPPDIYHSYLGLATLALLDIGKAGTEGVLARDVRHSSPRGKKKEMGGMPVVGNGGSGLVGNENETGEAEERRMDGGDEDEEAKEEEHHVRRWTGTGTRVSVQTIDDDLMEVDGGGEGGEVGDGGGVLRRLDPALCWSFRARDWIERLPWRKELLTGKEH